MANDVAMSILEGEFVITCQKWIEWIETELRRDTGYRSVPTGVGNKEYDEEYLDSLPHCPAFKGTCACVCVIISVH